jgi:transcriptional regulator with XRE-family HTH domain
MSSTRGQIVARRRAKLKLTQEDLARLCGCSVRTIQRIEQNESPIMSQEMIQALHEHLAMPLDELVPGKRQARMA